VRGLTSDGVQFLFAFNHACTPAQAALPVCLPWAAVSARDLENDRSVPVRVSVGKAFFRKTLTAGEIWVVRLSPR
jgi:hypothetical protein